MNVSEMVSMVKHFGLNVIPSACSSSSSELQKHEDSVRKVCTEYHVVQCTL